MSNGNVVRFLHLLADSCLSLIHRSNPSIWSWPCASRCSKSGNSLIGATALLADKLIEGPDPSGDERVPIGNRVDQGGNISVLKEVPFVGNLIARCPIPWRGPTDGRRKGVPARSWERRRNGRRWHIASCRNHGQTRQQGWCEAASAFWSAHPRSGSSWGTSPRMISIHSLPGATLIWKPMISWAGQSQPILPSLLQMVSRLGF